MNPRPDRTEFLAVTPAMRKRLETTIENLIALMDEIDGDPDLEPSLGFHLVNKGQEVPIATDDREFNGDEGDYDGGEKRSARVHLGRTGSLTLPIQNVLTGRRAVPIPDAVSKRRRLW